jgi:LacI family transcriptional regulator
VGWFPILETRRHVQPPAIRSSGQHPAKTGGFLKQVIDSQFILCYIDYEKCKPLHSRFDTGMHPTVYTVAEKAGVSIATVSRVINNSTKVHPKTRDRVLRVIEELDYHPNLSAQGLALNVTEIIALIFPDISGPFYSEVIRGVEKEASQHDYSLLIYGTHGKESNARFLRRMPGRVDGMILMTRSVDDHYIFELFKKSIPFVLLDREASNVKADCILSNNVEAAEQATLHLIQHGYRRIAFISGPDGSPDSNARFTGYRIALGKHDLPVTPSLLENGDFLQPGGYQAMNRLLDQAVPPDAVFAANDEMAIGAIEAIRSRGLGIPEDVAVVGFDDIQMASYIQPPLTTVRQPMREFGTLAVRQLLRRIQEPASEIETIVLPTQLILRQSCGCKPG